MTGTRMSSPWRVWWGRGSRKERDRPVQGGGGQHGGLCVLGGLLGPQKEDASVLIRGGGGEASGARGGDSAPF